MLPNIETEYPQSPYQSNAQTMMLETDNLARQIRGTNSDSLSDLENRTSTGPGWPTSYKPINAQTLG